MRTLKTLLTLTTTLTALSAAAALSANTKHHEHHFGGHAHGRPFNVQVGVRPYYLVQDLEDGALKSTLEECSEGPFEVSKFAIGHRGAALQFPEHTRESYDAAARQGAGIIECDVTFTSDRELVCRHSQCDLHTTTNILAIPELAAKCSVPFTPANAAAGTPATATCCTSDITLAEFKSLCGKMDASDPSATTVAEYLGGTPDFRTDLYATCGTVMTHAESIELIDSYGRNFTPELKAPGVPMPYQGTYTQEDFAQQMIDEYKQAGISPKRVWAQSFELPDILYWITHEPRFGKQAVYLDGRVDVPGGYDEAVASMESLVEQGVRVIAPPTWALVNLAGNGDIIPSVYADAANSAGLDMITWTLERSGLLVNGGGYYYQSLAGGIDNDGDTYRLLDTLAMDVGILGIFSDWPATVTYYANCMGL